MALFIIPEDSDLLAVLRDVEDNPVMAGPVSLAKACLWFSHKDHKETTGHKYRLLIDEIPVQYSYYGEHQIVYIR